MALTPHNITGTVINCDRCGGEGYFKTQVKGPFNIPGNCFRCAGTGVDPRFEPSSAVYGVRMEELAGHQEVM